MTHAHQLSVFKYLDDHTGPVRAVAFSPDSKMLATASDDETVRRWDATTGQPIGPPLTGHTNQVRTVAFSPDGTTIATASQDGTVWRWDAATGAPIGPPLSGRTDWVLWAAFSPDGTTIATAMPDQAVRLWPITLDEWIQHACTLAKRNLTQNEWNEFVGPDRRYVRACPDLPSGYGAPAATYRLG